MSRDLRHIPEDCQLVEITDRCFQDRFLLGPGVRLNAFVRGALARAAKRYDVGVVAFCFLSNHFHLLLRVRDLERMSGFMRFFKAKVAREVQWLHEWSDTVFPHRFHHIPVSNESDAQEKRLCYILAQGVKEGLVASPLHWPGANSTRELLNGRAVVGKWLDRSEQYRALVRGEKLGELAFTSEETLKLASLPCWDNESPDHRQARVAEMVADLEREAQERARTTGRKVLGRSGVLGRHPHASPSRPKTKSPKPRVHAATKRVRQHLVRSYYTFLDAYRTASEALRSGRFDLAHFPVNCFLPPIPRVLFDPG